MYRFALCEAVDYLAWGVTTRLGEIYNHTPQSP